MSEPKLKSQYAKRVQARERDIGRADLQRHEHVREAGEERRREHQQHDRAVHREQLVVLLARLDDLEAGLEELGADDQRHHAADAEVDERGDQVQVPDDLVVGGGDPPDEDVALALDLGGAERQAARLRPSRCGRGAHSASCSSFSSGAPVPGRFWLRSYSFDELALLAEVAQRLDVVLVLGLGDDLDVEEHERVVLAAELGALAVVGALALGHERHVVGLAREHVLLVEEVDDPERVDDVARLELDLDVLADGQVERRQLGLDERALGALVGELALDAGRVDVFVDVVEVPRPLLGDDLDLDVDLVFGEALLDRLPGRVR